jgi:hypothetical protein
MWENYYCSIWGTIAPHIEKACIEAQEKHRLCAAALQNGNSKGGISPHVTEDILDLYISAKKISGNQHDLDTSQILEAMDAYYQYRKDKYQKKVDEFKEYLP